MRAALQQWHLSTAQQPRAADDCTWKVHILSNGAGLPPSCACWPSCWLAMSGQCNAPEGPFSIWSAHRHVPHSWPHCCWLWAFTSEWQVREWVPAGVLSGLSAQLPSKLPTEQPGHSTSVSLGTLEVGNENAPPLSIIWPSCCWVSQYPRCKVGSDTYK